MTNRLETETPYPVLTSEPWYAPSKVAEDPSEIYEWVISTDTQSLISLKTLTDQEGDDMGDKKKEPQVGNIFGTEWGKSGGNSFFEATPTQKNIPAGFYRTNHSSDKGYFISKSDLFVDTLLALPDSGTEEVIEEFKQFWTLGPKFKEHGFTMKRGFLLYGAPGSGKTATIQRIIALIINEHDGIVLQGTHPQVIAGCAQMVRRLEPKRPIVIILEDFDALADGSAEEGFLSLLDGENQINNVVFLATTNYPEKLDRRFLDRPSRFDTIKLIGMPSAAARETYLRTKVPDLSAKEIVEWVNGSDGLSIAHLKELIIAVKCLGQPFEKVIERLVNMHQRLPTSEDCKGASTMGVLQFYKKDKSKQEEVA